MKRSAPARCNSFNGTPAEDRLNSHLQTYPFVRIDERQRKRPRTVVLRGRAHRSLSIEEPSSDSEPLPTTPEDSPVDDSTNGSSETVSGEEPQLSFGEPVTDSTSEISPPPTKVRRMQVGAGNSTATASSSTGKSVAERLKERRKDAHAKNACNNEANKGSAPSCSTLMPSKTTVPATESKPRRARPQLDERQKNTLRVINQYLRELGMHDTVETLVDESGCREEDPLAVRLRTAIKSHEWYEALNIIDRFKDKINPRDHTTIRVALIEELIKKYFIASDYRSVLLCLQHHYPRDKEFGERRKFYVTMLAQDPDKVSEFFKQQAKTAENRQLTELVEDFFPRTFMLASSRLEHLLTQSFESQLKNCALHLGREKIRDTSAFILRDHHCTVQDFPCKTTQIIQDHDTEVWVLKFSPCGKYLASAGKSGLVFIWKVRNAHKLNFHNRFIINDEIDGISSLSWSSDSQLLACGAVEPRTSGIYVLNAHHKSSGNNVPVEPYCVAHDKYSVADFLPTKSRSKIVCADTRGNFSLINMSERRSEPGNSFEGFRIRALVCLRNGKVVLAADTLNRIRSYDFYNHVDETIISESSKIMSFTVDKKEKFCLITTKEHGIRMWCLKTHTLVHSFYGSVHKEIVVGSCFGGVDDNFIASGCERNNSVLIWKRTCETPIKHLEGHTQPVNAVAWNPKLKSMLVSGSDDNTIRVWSTDPATTPSVNDAFPTNDDTKMVKRALKKKQKEKKDPKVKNGKPPHVKRAKSPSARSL